MAVEAHESIGPAEPRRRSPSISWADEMGTELESVEGAEAATTKTSTKYYIGAAAVGALLLALVCAVVVYSLFGFREEEEVGKEESAIAGKSEQNQTTSEEAVQSRMGWPVQPTLNIPRMTTRRPFNPKWSLLCTVGSSGILAEQYPSTVLCDFIFYTHVFFNAEQKRFVTTESRDSFDTFKMVAKKHGRGQYGVSFHVDFLADLSSYLHYGLDENDLSTLYEFNVQHYGVLNMIGNGSQLQRYKGDVLQLLPVMKKLQNRYEPLSPDSPCYLAVAVGLASQAELEDLPGLLGELAHQGANILVARTHIIEWNSWEDRGTAGATMWKNSRGIDKPDISTTLNHLITLLSPRYILMVSFTMGVASFMMSKEWANLSSRDISQEKPTKFSIVGYTEVCRPKIPHTATNTVLPEEFVVSGNKDLHCQYIYDTQETIPQKMHYTYLALENQTVKYNFGWALFDVDREDYNGTCSGVPFCRLDGAHKEIISLYKIGLSKSESRQG